MADLFRLVGEIAIDAAPSKAVLTDVRRDLKATNDDLTKTETRAKNLFAGAKATALEKVHADIARMQAQTAKGEQDLTNLITRQTEQQYRAKVAGLRRQTQEIVSELQKQARAEQEMARATASARSTGSFSLPGGSLLGLGAGGVTIGAAVATAKAAVDRAIEASRANRILASSAIEAGLSFDQATKKNAAFAASLGLSERQAAETSGAILRLAARTGKPEQADKLFKGFGDLGAAFGIDPNELQTLIGTILSGQDEGLNRLGIADPGALYKAYAKEIGKTADQLTQYEKVQAAVNAVIEKSATFAGAASDRMGSLEGQVARASASWDKLTTSMALSITQSPILTEALQTYSSLFNQLSVDIDQVNQKLSEGKTPGDIAKQLSPGPGLTERAQSFATGGYGVFGLLGQTGLLGDTFKDATDPDALHKRNLANLTEQIAKQDELNKKRADAAEIEKANTASRIAASAEQAAVDAQIKSIDDRLKLRKAEIGVSTESLEVIRETAAAERTALEEKLKLTSDENKKTEIENSIKILDLETQKKIELESQKKIKEEISKLDQMQDKALGSVTSLAAAQNNVFIDSYLALEKMRQSTAGISDNLRKSLESTIQVTNAAKLFKVSLDSQLSAASFGRVAERFRSPTKTDLFSNLNRSLALSGGASINEQGEVTMPDAAGRNVDAINSFASGRFKAIENFDKIEKRKDIDAAIRILSSSPGDAEQQAVVDKALLDFAQKFGVDDFDSRERGLIAGAADREQARAADSLTKQREFFETWKDFRTQITNEFSDLKDSVKAGGKLDVKITDESGKVNKVSTATPDDVRLAYGLSSSGGGLSSY